MTAADRLDRYSINRNVRFAEMVSIKALRSPSNGDSVV
jgi:hypothetical protein